MPLRRLIAAALVALSASAAPVPGADAVAVARAASDGIDAAAARLEAARGARDRIGALTGAVRAYEGGLAALREGLRALAVSEAALARDLAGRDARNARLVSALIGMARMPPPLTVLHPEGPLGAARAEMSLGAALPALEAEAAALRADLERLRTLRALEDAAMADLRDGLSGIQTAREALSAALAERTPLPPRADAATLDALRARARTLDAFADGLAGLPGPVAPLAMTRPLPLPVEGRRLRGFLEADAAGVARPGWVLAAASGALLTAPAAASVRHAGPLLDYGLVIVLEPEAGALMVLAGLAEAYVRTGEIVAAGAPLGLMGGTMPRADAFRADALGGGGASFPETLYVEAREDGRPVDPATWFAAVQ